LTLAFPARIWKSLGRIASGTLSAPEQQTNEGEVLMAKKAKKAAKKAPKKPMMK
jgi:hypothetical protein